MPSKIKFILHEDIYSVFLGLPKTEQRDLPFSDFFWSFQTLGLCYKYGLQHNRYNISQWLLMVCCDCEVARCTLRNPCIGCYSDAVRTHYLCLDCHSFAIHSSHWKPKMWPNKWFKCTRGIFSYNLTRQSAHDITINSVRNSVFLFFF